MKNELNHSFIGNAFDLNIESNMFQIYAVHPKYISPKLLTSVASLMM